MSMIVTMQYLCGSYFTKLFTVFQAKCHLSATAQSDCSGIFWQDNAPSYTTKMSQDYSSIRPSSKFGLASALPRSDWAYLGWPEQSWYHSLMDTLQMSPCLITPCTVSPCRCPDVSELFYSTAREHNFPWQTEAELSQKDQINLLYLCEKSPQTA